MKTYSESTKKTIYLVAMGIIGYFLAMLLRKYWKEGKDKTTFVGVVGTVVAQATQPKTSAFFAGLALYDLGHNAGITLLKKDELDLRQTSFRGIKNPTSEFGEYITYKGQGFGVDWSEWLPMYSIVGGEPQNNLAKALDKPYKETGLYFIRNKDKEPIYLGMTNSKTEGFHRLLRHFAQDNARNKRLTHEPYGKWTNYEFCVAQINNPTKERTFLLEEYYIRKFKPRDSWTDAEKQVLEDDIADEATYELLAQTEIDEAPDDLFLDEIQDAKQFMDKYPDDPPF